MKKALLTGLLGLALGSMALAQQPQPLFQNDGVINFAIDIDALAFANNGLFAIPVNANALVIPSTNMLVPPLQIINVNPTVTAYDFSDVLNFTNRGFMTCDTGFVFDTAPSDGGARHMAASFDNENPGAMFSGSSTSFFSSNFIFFVGVSPKLKISASNIVNTGTLDVGVGGLMTIGGKDVNLSRGSIHVEGFDNSLPFFTPPGSGLGVNLGTLDLGVLASYWGLGTQTNLLTALNLTPPLPFSPGEQVTNVSGTLNILTPRQIILTNPVVFANTNIISDSNITFQIVYVQDTLGRVATDCRFEPFNDFAVPIVRWSSVFTNAFTGQIGTNDLFLADSFGAATNLQLITNVLFTLNPTPAPVPANYSVVRVFPGYETIPGGNTAFNPGLLASGFGPTGTVTNSFTALGLDIQRSSIVFDPAFPTQNLTNIGGRVEINADNTLDLTGTLMGGPNYLKLTATNGHFVGSSNAILQYPYGDIALRSTNGLLNFTNITVPTLPRLNGPIDLYSARWTNFTRITVTNAGGQTNTVTVTNRYHILMVLSALNPLVSPQIKDLVLRSTNGAGNLVVSDVINVSNSMVIDAKSLTITSNAPGAPSPTGQINIISSNIIWSSSLSTNLLNVTNFGGITVANGVYFQKRIFPTFPSAGDGPYANFINHGTIGTGGGITVWAGNFENSGSSNVHASMTANFGPINVTANTAVLTNGSLSAVLGDVSLAAGSLTVSNHNLRGTGRLSLSATNLLTDGFSGPVNTTNFQNNVWVFGDGINLSVKPATGDLLGTTISNSCPANLVAANVWAGEDRGATIGGFLNNVGIGHLVLNGGNNASVFHFIAANGNNALYVDLLELAGGATNRVNNVFTALNVDSNMTVYFADAVIGALDISEKLNGANGGRLIWVPDYVGRFSYTNVTYPDAQTFQFNRALRASLTIDSDGDGTVNGADPTPFPEPFNAFTVGLSITMTNQPVKAAAISWNSPANSTNYLYYRTMLNSNWQVLTNFVQGSTTQRVTVKDPMLNGRLYKVRVDTVSPH